MSDDLNFGELRRLEVGALPAPWKAVIDEDHLRVVCTAEEMIAATVIRSWAAYEDAVYPDRAEKMRDTARLIAAMRNALPGLLDQLDQARSEAAALRRWLEAALPYVDPIDIHDRATLALSDTARAAQARDARLRRDARKAALEKLALLLTADRDELGRYYGHITLDMVLNRIRALSKREEGDS